MSTRPDLYNSAKIKQHCAIKSLIFLARELTQLMESGAEVGSHLCQFYHLHPSQDTLCLSPCGRSRPGFLSLTIFAECGGQQLQRPRHTSLPSHQQLSKAPCAQQGFVNVCYSDGTTCGGREELQRLLSPAASYTHPSFLLLCPGSWHSPRTTLGSMDPICLPNPKDRWHSQETLLQRPRSPRGCFDDHTEEGRQPGWLQGLGVWDTVPFGLGFSS